jgi:outer membrane protein assembly factor BamA
LGTGADAISSGAMRILPSSLAAGLVCLLAGLATVERAFAIGEMITDIRVLDNARTQEDTVRSLAGIRIGEPLEVDTLDKVRERLHSTGLFADVNVYWEPFREGVRVNIVIKDKFPWAPVPTFSYSVGNISGGLVIAHGNLFGTGKRGVVGGRLSTTDSGALLAYQDPAIFGSWAFMQILGRYQDRILPEFGNVPGFNEVALRETRLRSFGFSGQLGVAWFRRVRTAVGLTLETVNMRGSYPSPDNPNAPTGLGEATEGGTRGVGEASLTFDFRAREHAILYGNALSFNVQRGSPRFGSDEKFRYWKAGVEYEQGIRIFRVTNLVARASAVAGENLPFWTENWLGGTNLRGYLYRQFSGDTQVSAQVEYHFPLFWISQLQVRGLVFNDWAALYFRELPRTDPTGTFYEVRRDGRSYLPSTYLVPGFDPHRDIHGAAGVGIRFFLKSIAVPLVGADIGRGFQRGAPFRLVLVVGA